MKRAAVLLIIGLVGGCGSLVGIGRSVSLTAVPLSDCVLAAIDTLEEVTSTGYGRFSGAAISDAQYVEGHPAVIHQYRYQFDGFANSFQFAEGSDGSVTYLHKYRSDRHNGPAESTDEIFDAMSAIEAAITTSCDVDLEAVGSTRVCARVFGGCN